MAEYEEYYEESNTYIAQPSAVYEAEAAPTAPQEPPKPVTPEPPPPPKTPNLDWLKGIKFLKIKQNVDLAESLGWCEKANSYMIYAESGQHLADARESSGGCLRCLCRNKCQNGRGFTLAIKSFSHGESFICTRKFKPCVSWGCPPMCICCSDQLKVMSPDSSVMYGDCIERMAIWRKRYLVNDDGGNLTHLIYGPLCNCQCCCCCCKNITFKIYDHQKNLVGKIYKKWGGVAKEMLTDADTFVVEFDKDDMTLQSKATMIGLTFLIDFMYFEDNSPKDKVKDLAG